MIKSTWGLTKEPFYRNECALLPQQAEALLRNGDMIHRMKGENWTVN